MVYISVCWITEVDSKPWQRGGGGGGGAHGAALHRYVGLQRVWIFLAVLVLIRLQFWPFALKQSMACVKCSLTGILNSNGP